MRAATHSGERLKLLPARLDVAELRRAPVWVAGDVAIKQVVQRDRWWRSRRALIKPMRKLEEIGRGGKTEGAALVLLQAKQAFISINELCTEILRG